MAWAVVPTTVAEVTVNDLGVVLCLEDGSAVLAKLSEIKFDYRYDFEHDRWVDVSRVSGQPPAEGSDGNTDQEDANDGGPQVPG